MGSNEQNAETKRVFEPLEIMGIFWLVFGIVVLLASFFVEATPRVPEVRGVVTNIIAGLLLLGAGAVSILKGRANKKKRSHHP